MIVAITGTPGIGKTSVSEVLRKKEFDIVDLNKVAVEKQFLVGVDKDRDSKIVDVDKLSKHIEKNHDGEDVVFIDGHLSHLLNAVDKVIVLRCHPKILKKRLSAKNWKKQKIKENLEAEILDIILCETAELHSRENVFEIDTTDKNVDDAAECILEIIKNNFEHMKKYNMGNIDWSEEILKEDYGG